MIGPGRGGPRRLSHRLGLVALVALLGACGAHEQTEAAADSAASTAPDATVVSAPVTSTSVAPGPPTSPLSAPPPVAPPAAAHQALATHQTGATTSAGEGHAHPVPAASAPANAALASSGADGRSPGREAGAAIPATFAFAGSRDETERFMTWEREIQLTPEQEAVRVAALEALPAPCCKEFSAATCCCKCNMARSTWGLAKHLIVVEGAGVERVRAAAAAWHLAINPAGFSGDVCSTGGCGRAFQHNGCGGMKEGELVY